MLAYRIAFDSPWYLGLLVLLPVVWWSGLRTLAGLGRMRRTLALILRSVVLVAMVLALAEMQMVRRSDRLTVIYLLDQSLSIPEFRRRAMVEFVNRSIAEQRDQHREDRAGVIVFGRDAAVEIPPIDETVPLRMTAESLLDPNQTDLAGALKLALALFPHDAAKRIVLVSDGNETIGDVRQQAQALVQAGTSIDVVPVVLDARSDVAVEKLLVSSDVRRGQPFQLRAVLNNTTESDDSQATIRGHLQLVRRTGDEAEILANQPVELPPGKKVFTIREQIDQPDFYTYEARFVPDDPKRDDTAQNNLATTFTHVRGRGHVLLIEDWANPGEFDYLVERLRSENLEVTVQPSDRLFTNLTGLQRYDAVVLANVPRSSGDDADQVTHFSDAQIEMLVRNTQQMGSGLVMLGGQNSFGAGGWTGTGIERAMPVDFHIKSAKVKAVGALVLIMHAGEMPRGNYWQKVVSREAIKALGVHDYCGLVHWNGTDQWLWARSQGGIVRVGPNRKTMLALLDRMTPGDMPQFDGSLVMAANGLAKLRDAAVKHMIIISDGDPSPPRPATIQRLRSMKVKVSTVAVGSHGTLGSNIMQRISTATGGKYYVVKRAAALPRIYQREARRIARPLVYENRQGMVPKIKFPHEMLKGIQAPIPPITGFVRTSVKDNPLVEVALVSPKPVDEKNATLLASWTYGLGRAVALTTDAGKRWATDWTGWENYDKFYSQVIRWSMRPTGERGKFTVATDLTDGRGRVVVTALDRDDEFLNFLDMTGTVLGPNMKAEELTIRQIAPGRYLGDFAASAAGSYLVVLNPGPGQAPIRMGVNVGYSDEFRDREPNRPLLEELASLSPTGGRPGQVLGQLGASFQPSTGKKPNPFRHDLPRSTASQDVWHWLMLAAACLFFTDVLNRRVSLGFAWARPWVEYVRTKIFRREARVERTETIGRLRSTKQTVTDQLADRQRGTRFEPDPTVPTSERPDPSPQDDRAAPPSLEPEQEEESYTERLLKAKERARRKRDF